MLELNVAVIVQQRVSVVYPWSCVAYNFNYFTGRCEEDVTFLSVRNIDIVTNIHFSVAGH